MRRNPAMDRIADILWRRHQQRKAQQLRGSPAMTHAVVHVVIVTLKEDGHLFKRERQLMNTHGGRLAPGQEEHTRVTTVKVTIQFDSKYMRNM